MDDEMRKDFRNIFDMLSKDYQRLADDMRCLSGLFDVPKVVPKVTPMSNKTLKDDKKKQSSLCDTCIFDPEEDCKTYKEVFPEFTKDGRCVKCMKHISKEERDGYKKHVESIK